MDSVAGALLPAQPTNAVPLAELLAYTQALGLERWLRRPKRGLSTLVLSLLWLVLAWHGSGRPSQLAHLEEPLLALLLGVDGLPTAETLRRSLASFPTQAVRRAVEAAYQAELARRPARIWAALDSHQLPYWGRGQRERLEKGWSGAYGRCLRGYRLYLAVDTATGQIITFVLLRGGARDHRLTTVLARHLRASACAPGTAACSCSRSAPGLPPTAAAPGSTSPTSRGWGQGASRRCTASAGGLSRRSMNWSTATIWTIW